MSTEPRDLAHESLWSLLEAVCEGTLTAEQTRQLEELVLHDAEARWIYLQYLSVHAVLPRHVGGRRPSAEIGDLLAAPAERTAAPLVAASRPVAHWLAALNQPAIFGLIFAASFLFAGVTLLRIMPMPGTAASVPPPIESAESAGEFATVTHVANCRWRSANFQPHLGAAVPVGQVLHLEAGVAEITLQNSVRILLQGPGSWEVSSAQSSRLHQGRLTVRVPVDAAGYTIETPSAIVVDLGTEFGVEVDRDGGSSVDVFQGRVLIKPRFAGEEGLVVEAGHGGTIRPDPHPLTRRPVQEQGYLRSFTNRPPRLREKPVPAEKPVVLAHWSLDQIQPATPNGPPTVLDRSEFGRHAHVAGAPQATSGAAEYGGVQALKFSAEGDAVVFRPTPAADGSNGETLDINFDQFDSFTLEAVVRVDPQAANAVGAILAKDWAGNQPSWWLRVNQGTLEGLVSDFDEDNQRSGLARGRTPLADGRWRHVALVRDGEQRRVRLYIDHQLEAAVDDNTLGTFANDQAIRIGAFNATGRQFIGDIQFARITRGALAPRQFVQPARSKSATP